MFKLPTLFLFQSDIDIDRATGSQSIAEILTSGGWLGMLIIAVLLVLSFIAVYIFVERYRTIGRADKVDDNFMNNISINLCKNI